MIRVRSAHRPGRVIPRRAEGLRAGVVVLQSGEVMDWHSTDDREELLIVLEGRVALEVQRMSRIRRVALRNGHCALVPHRTRHRVVNRFRSAARYLYVTGAAR